MAENGFEGPFVVGYVTSPHPHAGMHINTLDVLHTIEAVHLCGIEGEDLNAMSALSDKVVSTTTSLEELLAREDVDALVVCVRNDLCPGILEASVRAGKPALFEKPGAVRSSDLRRVAELARENGLPMGAMFQNRLGPAMDEIRQARREGALGRVMAVEARMVTSQIRYRDPSHWLFSRKMAGSGILSWLGCHYIDLLCYLLEERIVEVTAMIGTQNPESIDVEDTACITFRFEGGALGTMMVGYHLVGSVAGYSSAAYDSFLALRGTDGFVRIPVTDRSGYTMMSVAPGWASDGVRDRTFRMPKSVAYGGLEGQEFVNDFLRAASVGGSSPIPIEDAVHVLDVIEAVIESSQTGRAIRVAQSVA